LLEGVVKRARLQIGLFTVILTVTASVIVTMVIYNLTLEKTHDLAVLSCSARRAAVCSAWCCSRPGSSAGSAMRWRSRSGSSCSRLSPRRVVLTETITTLAPIATFAIVTLASALGVSHVLRVDPARALEG
jgi:putative ABC transport system permease protein